MDIKNNKIFRRIARKKKSISSKKDKLIEY